MFTDSAWHLAKVYLLSANACDKDIIIPLVDSSTFVFQSSSCWKVQRKLSRLSHSQAQQQ
jgi:hypothetical protein